MSDTLSTRKKLELELSEVVDKIIQQQEKDILKNSSKEIVSALIPTIEDLVAKRVKSHLRQIGTFIIEMTKEKEKPKDDSSSTKKEDSGSKDS